MTGTTIVGSVARIWRFPVKSMKGEQLEQGEFTATGVVGDRAYALIDKTTGKVASAKNVRQFPDMFACHARFMHEPKVGQPLPAVAITLADGSVVTSDSDNIDQVLSDFFGRDVTLANTAPDDFTIDMYRPEIDGADPHEHRGTVVEQKLGAALFADTGVPSPVPVGAFFDAFPLTLLTTATLRQLQTHQPGSVFDERRFRMNVIVDTREEGFVENAWIDRTLALGEDIQIEVAKPDARCVMTTLAQDELKQDINILRAMVQHNRLQVGGNGPSPCAGVYAIVMTAGTLRSGDAVSLAQET